MKLTLFRPARRTPLAPLPLKASALSLAALLLGGAASPLVANTPDNVVAGQTDLTAAGTYSGGLPGTGSDVTFTATAYSPAAFTLNTNGFNLSIGTLDDLSATALTIQNTTAGSTSTLTLNGGANATTGANAADLLYVATGGSLSIGGGAGTLNLALAASGNFDIAGTAIVNSAVSGAFAVTKTGAGSLTLAGANTYSGGTTATGGGTLKLGSSSVGTAGTVGSNGSLTSGALGTGSLIVTTNAATLDLNGQTLGNRFSSSVNNTTVGNTSAATATVSGAMDGSLTGNVISDFQVGGNNGDILWTGQISRTSGTLGFTKIGSNTATFSGTVANVGVGSAADQVKVSAGTLGLGMTGTSAGTFGDSVTVQGGTLKFRPDLGTVSGGNLWGGQINGNLQMTSGTVDLNGSSGQNSRQQQFYGTGGTVTNTSATAGVLGIAARNNAAYTFGGTIQDGTGTVGIDFTNSGTASSGRINQFTGANTYSGATTVSYGTFELGNALAAQNSTVVLNAASGLGANGTIAYTTVSPLAFANGIGTFTVGGLSGSTNLALTDIGFTNANAAATAASVTLQIGSSLAANANPAAYTGVISDGTAAGGKIVKIGTSTAALNGTNLYTGGTTIKNGTLSTTNNAGLGAGTITLGDTTGANNAALSVNILNTLVNNVTVAAGSSGTRTIAATNGGGSTATFSGAVALNADLILQQNFGTTNAGTLALSGQITGPGNLLVSNTGGVANSVTLSGNNAATFTGNVSVTNGEILRANGSALGTANAVTIDSASQLNSNGGSLTVAGLNSTGTGGTVVISTSTAQTLTLGGGGIYSYAGVINNGGGVTKSGGGTQTLSGNNTYSGATTVSGGTLLFNGTNTGAGAVGVTAGTLGGSGMLTASVTVSGGAALAPGGTTAPGSTAKFTVGALTLGSTANFNLDLNNAAAGTGYDQVITTGAVSLGGSNLNVSVGAGLNAGDKLFILDNGSATAVTGTFAGLANGTSFTVGPDTFTINYFDTGDATAGNDVSLTVNAVPEPSTWTAGLLGLAILGWHWRRGVSRRQGCV